MKPRTAIIKALEGGDIGWTAEKLKATLELDEPVDDIVKILKELRDGGYVTIKHTDNTYYSRTARMKGYLANAVECPHCHEMYHKYGASFHMRKCPERQDGSTMTQAERESLIELLQRFRKDTMTSLKAMAIIKNSRLDVHIKAKEELVINIDTVLANLGVMPSK